jgi:serine protease AprX
MRHAAKFVRLVGALVLIAAVGPSASARLDASPAWFLRLDPLLQQRAARLTGRSTIIVRAIDAQSLGLVLPIIQQIGGTLGRPLPIINGQVADVPNPSLFILASNPLVQRLSLDRLIVGANERTGATVGATAVRQDLGYDGAGVGVAVIDSGVTSWHDDLTDASGSAQRVDRFVDFVNGRQDVHDDYGHGTHVAGIIAGNGSNSGGARSGIAPAARLTVLKVLDGSGRGRISDVIAALGFVIAHKNVLNLRVVNLSVASGVYESYNSDPLTLAALCAVREGIVVVAAAGNGGKDPQGRTQYGGITAPGNAPWVLTVGASSHMGTVVRADDTIAAFSSRGPGAVDRGAKPDIVAPGVGIESLSNPASAFYTTRSAYLLNGTAATSYLPYLSLSGTSMAAPVVTGTVALMLQANPALTPNEVKAILQYTAQAYPGYGPLTQGAGFLNARGAVELARFFALPSSAPYPSSSDWSARLVWGNHLIAGGRLTADANAWSIDVTWGDTTTRGGEPVTWGVSCSSVSCDTTSGAWRWEDGSSPNVVWGSQCGGADCHTAWSARDLSATSDDDDDTVVWGTNDDEGDTVVWGTSDDEGDTVVWGTSCSDSSCSPVIWQQ